MAKQSLARFKLLGIFAAFGFPLLLATIAYINSEGQTLERTNKGTLIEPPRPIATAALIGQDGKPLSQEFFTRQWHIVLWAGSGCDLWCEANLFKIRQARLVLGRRAARVDTAYLSTSDRSFQKINKTYPSIALARFTDTSAAGPQSAKAVFGSLPTQQIYIVDPLGNVLMSYPKDVTARFIVKDMKHLLKASKIG